jgi:hypothetical protein
LPDLLAVRNNLEVLQELLTSESIGSFLPQRCTVVLDSVDPRSVCGAIREAGMTATDTLLVYFSGHGVLNEDLTELHLALTDTDENDLRWTSIPFQAVREVFEASPCPRKVLILDCCNSGQVLDSLMGDRATEPEMWRIRGTHILTSSARDLPSFAPVGERYTAFSGELIRLLRDGLPGRPKLLTLSELYGPLSKALVRNGYPEPRQQGSDGYAQLALVRNRAASTSTGNRPDAQTEDDGWGTLSEVMRGEEIRFGPNRAFARMRKWGIGLPVQLALLTVLVTNMPAGNDNIDLTDPHNWAATISVLGFMAVDWALGRWHPVDYSLTVSPDGVEVRYGGSKHFSYPWHRVSRCWIRQEPATWLRGPKYHLMVRSMPGVFPHTASRSTPGPRQDDTEDTLRFANLNRLAATPEAVETALSTYGGTAWTPSPGITVHQMTAPQAEQVFTADRRILAAVAVPCTAFLAWQLVAALFVRPSETSPEFLSVLLYALSFAGAWFSVSRLVRPVRLVIGAAGLTLIRGELEIAYAWTEIERIGVVNWPRGARAFGLLAIRPSGSAEGRVDRTSMFLPRLAPGCLTLCLLPEVTHHQQSLEAAVARFADEHQVALAAEAWLRVKAKKPRPPGEGVTLRGRQPAKVSTLIVVALIALSMASVQLQTRADWVMDNLLTQPLLFVGIPAYFVTGRHQVSFHIGPTGITVRAFGKQRLHIPWSDLDRVGVVCLSDPKEHALVLWPRPGAAIPRSALLPFRRRYGGLRLLTLQHYRIEVSPERMNQALARYAGRRHTQMALLR